MEKKNDLQDVGEVSQSVDSRDRAMHNRISIAVKTSPLPSLPFTL